MSGEDYQSWDDLVARIMEDEIGTDDDRIRVERHSLAEIANDLSRLVYATERRYQETADRLVFEHRERFRQDLIAMNNLRIRLNAMLRHAGE